MKGHDPGGVDGGGAAADLNVPLSPGPPSARRREAAAARSRLRRGGVADAAFVHTAYGRAEPGRDGADAALPWDVLLGGGGTGIGDDSGDGARKKNRKKRRRTGDGGVGTFGRTSGGLRIYRRLNVVIEEAADASRLLAPAGDGAPDRVAGLLGGYDMVSLQPMNESAMRCVCELLASDGGSAGLVDVVTLEYATGSRGGSGPPYRIREEYVAGALSAGVTFEVNYAAAVLDPKRRQGFVRTLKDFASALGGVQKRRALLGGRRGGREARGRGYPLLVSSGPRKNYTRGTDEGVEMSLRRHDDVRFMVRHLAGGDGGALDPGSTGAAGRVLARARDRRAGLASDGRPGGGRARRLVRDEGDGDDGKDEGSDSDDSEDGMPDGDIVAWLSRAPVEGRRTPPGGGSDGEDAAADYEELLAHVRGRRGAGGADDVGPSGANDEDGGKVGAEEDRVERSTKDGEGERGDEDEDLGDGFIAF